MACTPVPLDMRGAKGAVSLLLSLKGERSMATQTHTMMMSIVAWRPLRTFLPWRAGVGV